MNIINNTYRFIAVFMAVLVFVTSVGLNVDLHYCGGQLKNLSFIGKAASCHENTMKDCPFHKKMMAENGKNTFSSKSCCSNKTVYLQSDLDKNAQSVDYLVSSQLQQFVVAYVTIFLTTKIVKSIPVSFAEYSPPNISRDIYVLIQSFLI